MEEEKKPINIEENKENKEPEIDLIDEEGHKEKTEVYEEKEERKIKDFPTSKSDDFEESIKEEIIKPKEEKKEKPKIEVPKEPISRMSEISKISEHAQKPKVFDRIINFYDKQYKKLMIIPFVILILAIIVIGIQTLTTGSFIHKDVSLKGGITLTITKETGIDILALEKSLEQKFTKNDISVRSIKEGGTQKGIIIIADIDGTNKEELNSFIDAVKLDVGELNEEDYSVEIMGSSLGASFFRETFIALIMSFVFICLVILIYFRALIPSLAIILATLSDIVITLAIVDLIGMKLTTGGIAAFLMIIGYGVDTNVLLNTRVLKRKEGTILERIIGAFKTGMMMTLTAAGAVIIGMIFIESDVVRQIMIIVLIGLIVDILTTWIQNAGILRYYIERNKIKI